MKASERGFGLLDAALSLLALSAVAAVAVAVSQSAVDRAATAINRDLVSSIEESVSAYAQLNGRLPCPAQDASGVEHCDGGAATGQVPYATLGLPNAGAGSFIYTLFPIAKSDGTSDNLTNSVIPTVLQLQTDVALTQPTVQAQALDNTAPNGHSPRYMGFCQRLEQPVASGQGNALAFSLSLSTGNLPTSGVSVKELSTAMACTQGVSTALRAYPNLASSFTALVRNVSDIRAQMAIELNVAQADLANASVVAAVIGPAKVGISIAQLTASAAVCLTDQTKCAAAITDGVNQGLYDGYEAAAIAKEARFVLNYSAASDNYSNVQTLLGALLKTANDVSVRAENSAASAIFNAS
ncbi:hypothetical protein [Burkholderia gladioli]|uniref:hypothetical protein n=1 Tax=Burkholderia gladioli TaxID=28095 RepID=UPI001641AFD3|nr:hypothetical protein [Burkholderia gladioli]